MSLINAVAIHRARVAGLGIEIPRIGAERTAGSGFAETLTRALGEVSASQDRAREVTGAFMRGEPVEMHQVMAAAEEAGIAIEMLVGISNKLQEAYRSVISMQS